MLGAEETDSSKVLLAAVHIFVSETGDSETAVLRGAGVDKKTLLQVRRGRSCTYATGDKILNYLGREWRSREIGDRRDFWRRVEAALASEQRSPEGEAEQGGTTR